jgi:pilus assembly protein CpaB
MRRSGKLLIAMGVALALVAVALVVVVLMSDDDDPDDPQSGQGTDTTEVREITVIVAARDIPAHTVLTQDDVREEQVQSDEVSGDAVRSTLEVVGLSYSVDLVSGQPLLQTDVELPGLANSVQAGWRAYALPVSGAQLLGGLLRDDDHIDLIFSSRVLMQSVLPSYPLELEENVEFEGVSLIDPATGEEVDALLPEYGGPPIGPTYPYHGEDGSRFWMSDMEDGEPITNVMIQNVRILRVVTATETEDSDSSDEGSYLVLELDPTQTELVEFLSNTGTVEIVLRNPEDSDVPETPGVTMNALVDDWDMRVPRTVRMPDAGAQ